MGLSPRFYLLLLCNVMFLTWSSSSLILFPASLLPASDWLSLVEQRGNKAKCLDFSRPLTSVSQPCGPILKSYLSFPIKLRIGIISAFATIAVRHHTSPPVSTTSCPPLFFFFQSSLFQLLKHGNLQFNMLCVCFLLNMLVNMSV